MKRHKSRKKDKAGKKVVVSLFVLALLLLMSSAFLMVVWKGDDFGVNFITGRTVDELGISELVDESVILPESGEVMPEIPEEGALLPEPSPEVMPSLEPSNETVSMPEIPVPSEDTLPNETIPETSPEMPEEEPLSPEPTLPEEDTSLPEVPLPQEETPSSNASLPPQEASQNTSSSETPSISSEEFSVQGAASATSCGEVTAPITLTSDVQSGSTCFNISTGGANIDCAGKTVTYGTGSGGQSYGVNNSDGRNSLTVRNCIFIYGGTGGPGNFGIYDVSGTNANIFNNTFFTHGASSNIGIYFGGSDDGQITNNTIVTNGSGVNNYGIYIELTGLRNRITGNVILTNGSQGGDYGIFLDSGSNHTVVNNNSITTGGGSHNNWGLYLQKVGNTSVNNNRIATDGRFRSNYGTYLVSASNNTFINNKITTNGSSDNFGILLQDARENVFMDNQILTEETSAKNSSALVLTVSSNSNLFVNNNLTGRDMAMEIVDFSSSSTNFIVYNNTFGEIKWLDNGTGSFLRNLTLNTSNDLGFGLDRNLFIGNNTIAVNASAFNVINVIINGPANATLRGLTLTSANFIVRAANFTTNGTFLQSHGADCGFRCDNLSYSGNTATFNFTSDASYAVEGCGQITADKTLVGNVSSAGNCMEAVTSPVTLDCAGRTITFGNSTAGRAINATSYNNITVKNCVISGGTSSGGNTAISLSASLNSYIFNNTIFTYGTSGNTGILLQRGTNDTQLVNNSITTNSTTSGSEGIIIDGSDVGSFRNSIIGNVIFVNGSSANRGINLAAGANHTLIDNNSITTYGTGSNNRGIDTSLRTGNTTISNNRIATGGAGGGNEGILIQSGHNNTITSNRITTNGTSSNYGIKFVSSSHNIVKDNQIITEDTSGGDNIPLYLSSTNQSLFVNNNLTALRSAQLNFLIFDDTSDAVVNYLIYNNTFGEIKWIDNGTGSFLRNLTLNVTNDLGIGLDRNIFIGNNTIALNTSAFNIGLGRINGSANITIKGINLTYGNLVLKLSNFTTDTNVIRSAGKSCTSPSCGNILYSGNTLTFNVTGFSSFAGEEGCGTYATSKTLTADLSSTGSCFELNASNTVLDCSGRTITYGTSATGIGVNVSGYDNVTVKNCIIRKGSVTGSSNYGVYLYNGVVNGTIQNNTIFTDGTGENIGVYLFAGVNFTNILGNIIFTNGSSILNHGIKINVSSFNNTINGNAITTNGTTNNFGIFLGNSGGTGANFTVIENNSILARGTDKKNYGIYLLYSSNVSVVDNIVNTSGTASNSDAIFIDDGSLGFDILRNRVNPFNGIGIGVSDQTRAGLGNIAHNVIRTNGNNSAHYGISLSSTTWGIRGITINNNTIYTNGSRSDNVGIQLSDQENNTIIGNFIYTNGTNESYGIYILGTTINQVIENNVIIAGGSGGDNDGIRLSGTNSNNTQLINNNISVGSGSGFIIKDLIVDINYLIYNNSFGEIKWIDNGTGSFLRNLTLNVTNDQGIGLDRNIFIGNNSIALNTSAFNIGLGRINGSANITLRGLGLTSATPRIHKLANYTTDPNFIGTHGTDCSGSTCAFFSYTGGVLIFNTTSFSSFAGNETDITPPNATNITPVPDSSFTVGDTISFSVNVTDNGFVSSVSTNLSYPNGSIILFNLSNTTSFSRYTFDFTAPSVTGNYNFTIIANDTLNNRNTTEKGNFSVAAAASSSTGGGGTTTTTPTTAAPAAAPATTAPASAEGETTTTAPAESAPTTEATWATEQNDFGAQLTAEAATASTASETSAAAASGGVSGGTDTVSVSLRNSGEDVLTLQTHVEETIVEETTFNTERARQLLAEQLDAIPAEKIEEQLLVLQLMEEEEVQTLLGKIITFFNSEFRPTQNRIMGNFLLPTLIDGKNIILQPGESLEKEFMIQKGLSTKPRKLKLRFVAEDGRQLVKSVVSAPSKVVGTAVDYDAKRHLMDLYFVIPKEGGDSEKHSYWFEFALNEPTGELPSSEELITGLSVAQPVPVTGTVVADLLGPFEVSRNESFFFAQQFKIPNDINGTYIADLRLWNGKGLASRRQTPILITPSSEITEQEISLPAKYAIVRSLFSLFVRYRQVIFASGIVVVAGTITFLVWVLLRRRKKKSFALPEIKIQEMPTAPRPPAQKPLEKEFSTLQEELEYLKDWEKPSRIVTQQPTVCPEGEEIKHLPAEQRASPQPFKEHLPSKAAMHIYTTQLKNIDKELAKLERPQFAPREKIPTIKKQEEKPAQKAQPHSYFSSKEEVPSKASPQLYNTQLKDIDKELAELENPQLASRKKMPAIEIPAPPLSKDKEKILKEEKPIQKKEKQQKKKPSHKTLPRQQVKENVLDKELLDIEKELGKL